MVVKGNYFLFIYFKINLFNKKIKYLFKKLIINLINLFIIINIKFIKMVKNKRLKVYYNLILEFLF